MDIGPFHNSDPWRRAGQGKQDTSDQVGRAPGTFQRLLRGMAESPAGSAAGTMRYNASGPGEAFAKAFSEMPLVAPVASDDGELPASKTARGAASHPMTADGSLGAAEQPAVPVAEKIEKSFRIEGSTIKFADGGDNIARQSIAEPSSFPSQGGKVAWLPSRPASLANSAFEKPPAGAIGKAGTPSARLSPAVVQILPSDAGIRISVRLGKLTASENERLRTGIFAVAREFGHPLTGLAIITSERG